LSTTILTGAIGAEAVFLDLVILYSGAIVVSEREAKGFVSRWLPTTRAEITKAVFISK
jgi:hypothetical protein